MLYNICFSPTGGTRKVADILAARLGGADRNIDLCRDPEGITLHTDDICLVSVPSYSGRVPAIAIRRIRKIQANGAKAILNCVYGNRAWEDTLTELQDTLEACGFVCAAAVAAVAEHSIFRQFAAGRPDDADTRQLTEFADRILEKLQAGVFGDLHLAGSHGTYKEISRGGALLPEANGLCTACGLCADSCPVGAIDRHNSNKTDKEICIGCMRCVRLCPQHARDFDAGFMQTMTEKFAAGLSGRKENTLFL
ncbi:MAG: 4Fe-4S ferredoxin [Ruminococcaceae bacterium]|nr:4Fe-4S ferredoxin [Oscillospiraceae bacterium]